MKNNMLRAALALAFSVAAIPAMAQAVEFKLVNASSYILTYFYASPSTETTWGEDLLAEVGVLEPGYEGAVHIGNATAECLYDFRFETAEGPELEVPGIDICQLESYTLTDE